MFLVNNPLNNRLPNPFLSITDIPQPNELRHPPGKKTDHTTVFKFYASFPFCFMILRRPKYLTEYQNIFNLLGASSVFLNKAIPFVDYSLLNSNSMCCFFLFQKVWCVCVYLKYVQPYKIIITLHLKL